MKVDRKKGVTSGKRKVKKRTYRGMRKKKRSIYDINKGVDHNIPPPKAPKVTKTSLKKKPQTPQNVSKNLIKMTSAERVGSLTPTVGVVVKHGEFKFIRRRSSPRKSSPAPSSSRSSATRKTLFSPCSTKNYPRPSPKKSNIGGSPIKFTLGDEDEEEKMSGALSNSVDGIIEGLDGEESSYTVTTTHDEYDNICKKIAEETVMQLEELNCSGMEIIDGELRYASESSPHVTPKKVLTPNPSPAKKVLCNTPVRSSPRNHGKENRVQGGTPKKLSPKKRPDSKPGELFSVFKSKARTGLQFSPKKVDNKRKSKTFLGDSSNNQMIIDAGQKKIGPIQCKVCKFVYHAGHAEDENMHELEHNTASKEIPFRGWRNENVVKEDPALNLRILSIQNMKCPKSHWSFAMKILQEIDRNLGIQESIRNEKISRFYLAVSDNLVVGGLLAEPLAPTDVVSKSFLKSGSRVTKEISINRNKLVGVSRIWVHNNHQRKGIATHLMLGMQNDFWRPTIVKKVNIAFTHTSDMGSAFASKFFSREEFLVYHPKLEQN